MTYLQLVNSVLLRLRESQVSTVSETTYSQLIGAFVNEAKRQVEDAWNWNALSTTATVTCAPSVSTYSVVGSGYRQKDVKINDTTNKISLANVSIQWIVDQQQLTNVQTGDPSYFAWNGFDGTDSKIELWPTPNSTNVLKVNMNVPQAELASDNTSMTIPAEPVIAGAYARALVERGEDGGLQSSEAYALYRGILSDLIALEQTRFPEWDNFSIA